MISGYFSAVLRFQAAALPNKKASMERLKAWAGIAIEGLMLLQEFGELDMA